MKKAFYTFLTILFATFFTQPLDAGDCQGKGQVWWCMSWELDDIKEEAWNNCCAGSTVVTYNWCLDEVQFVQVEEDGPNSSCAQQ